MSTSFDFTTPDLVVPGAVGTPGQRIFFVQASEDGRTVSFKVEKQQVAALCEYLGGILTDLPPVGGEDLLETPTPVEPTELAWVVGRLAVAYEEADDRIVIVAEEFIAVDPDSDLDLDDPAALIEAGFDPATARVSLTRAQVAAFIAVGNDLVQAGRPLCRLCGRPMDPEGHLCPRLN